MSKAKPNYCNDIAIEQMLSLNDSFWITLATRRNGHVVTWSKTKCQISFSIPFKKGDYSLEGGAIARNVPPQLRHCWLLNTFIIQNIYTQKVDKPIIYVMTESEKDT